MLKFLVVEDDESIRKIMGWVLDSLGYPSVLKATGEQALADPSFFPPISPFCGSTYPCQA